MGPAARRAPAAVTGRSSLAKGFGGLVSEEAVLSQATAKNACFRSARGASMGVADGAGCSGIEDGGPHGLTLSLGGDTRASQWVASLPGLFAHKLVGLSNLDRGPKSNPRRPRHPSSQR